MVKSDYEMEIKGFAKSTLIDWEGKVASTIWIAGCNLRCPYCYATDLVLNPAKLPTIPLEEVLDFLKEKKGWIDGVVICGGEPTIHSDLPQFIQNFKKIPIAVKLDTNGTNPGLLKSLIKDGLLDYVAMDLKAPLNSKYNQAAGSEVNLEKIKETIDVLLNCDLDYEFRTTVCPVFIGKDDIIKMAGSVKSARKYILQQFKPGECMNKEMNKTTPYTTQQLEDIIREAKKFCPNIYLRGQARGGAV